ncbi:hypothetical protein [Dyella silvatica]|uniref:hypothetical protein n=1 Tax=Dyella silvatica TaxID=2992128 RepID=UPI00225977D4|nr:hypothetical protein [Dyella silvatica]
MQAVNKIGLIALSKIVFAFTPIVAAVYCGCYFIMKLMISHDMGRFAYAPWVLSLILLCYIAKALIGDDFKKLVELRKLDVDKEH